MAFSCFLKMKGKRQGDIKGESTIQGYKDWIEVQSYSWGTDAKVSHSVSTSGALSAGRADSRKLSISKKLDIASTGLITACIQHEHLETCTLHVCRQVNKTLECILAVDLKEGLVASYDTDGSTGDVDVGEKIEIVFAEIEFVYTRFDSGGKKIGNNMATWSFARND